MTHLSVLSLHPALGFTRVCAGRSINNFSLFLPSNKLGFITSTAYGISCVTFVPFSESSDNLAWH